MTVLFADRADAGRQLAGRLVELKGRGDLMVLGIPRGGVVVAAEVASELGAPLDVLLAHKLGAPFNSELAIGAIAGDGVVYLDDPLIRELGIRAGWIEEERERQLREMERRAAAYRQGRPPLALADKVVVLCDDGVATGSTTIAALRALTMHRPARRILAVPVAPRQTALKLERECDEMVILAMPDPFLAVGRFFQEFGQVSDEEVAALLGGG